MQYIRKYNKKHNNPVIVLIQCMLLEYVRQVVKKSLWLLWQDKDGSRQTGRSPLT